MSFHLLAFLVLIATGSAARERRRCSTDLHADLRDTYVFGYGSLLDQASVVKTNCGIKDVPVRLLSGLLDFVDVNAETTECILSQPDFIPVRVRGVRRGWYTHGHLAGQDLNMSKNALAEQKLDLQPTYLGALQDPSSTTMGVLYQVSAAQLRKTDERERMGGYQDAWLPLEDIEVLDGSNLLRCARVRWYAMTEDMVQEPNEQFPIVQSYVDMFIGGALELEKKYDLTNYAMELIMSTKGWSRHWLNDRPMPHRYFASNSNGKSINRLLLEATRQSGSPLTMDILDGIEIEGQR